MAGEKIQNQVDKPNDATERLNDFLDTSEELASARDWGVDLHMLAANLNRTVAERIKRHQIALDTFQKLRNARKL